MGSDSYQGAGAPTMFEAMRRITDCLDLHSVRESSFARAIRCSFLGTFPFGLAHACFAADVSFFGI